MNEIGPTETIARFETASNWESASSREVFDYADALRLVGRRTDALKAFEALESKGVPKSQRWRVCLFRGEVLQDMGRFAEAEAEFRASSELADNTAPIVYLAVSLANQERFEEAICVLREALARPGDTEEVLLKMALSQRTLGLYQDALGSVASALKLSAD